MLQEKLQLPKNSVMVVDSDEGSASELALWLEEKNYSVVVAHSAAEAIQLLHDIAFIGCNLDALLASYHPREATCCRILSEFRYEYPWAAAALMLDADDIAINCWARTRNIPVLYKPLTKADLERWLRSQDGIHKRLRPAGVRPVAAQPQSTLV
jgi:CheY-like chemotaxis protein